MILLAPMSTRNQFGWLLNTRGLIGEAVEVGTHRGEFARILLHDWRGKHLSCIDPWAIPPGYEKQSKTLWGDGDAYNEAKRRLAPHKNKVSLIRKLSSEACSDFLDKSLDFVYLDGNHEPPYVEEDIRLWWPKIGRDGILAGHDIIMPGEIAGGWGQYIQPAVFDFAKEQNIDVYLVVEENGMPWSYYLIKP